MRDPLLRTLVAPALALLGLALCPGGAAAPPGGANVDVDEYAHAHDYDHEDEDEDEDALHPEHAMHEAAVDALHTDPARALAWIERADADFGDDDEARRALEIEVRVALGTVGHARALTRRFYARYPDSEAIPYLERLTGYHPR